MKKITSSEQFMDKAASLFADIASVLSTKEGIRLSSVSTPQNVACYQVSGVKRCLLLRLVLIPMSTGHVLARLSWLDGRGIDHVCCYLNESFERLLVASDGGWKKQKKSAELLCLQGFESLIA